MTLKTEIRIAKVITASLIAITLFMASHAHAGEIAELFRYYNRSLSQKQALQLEAIVNETAGDFAVPFNLIASIIVVESSARPHVISKGGDYGLMQVRWKVHHRDYPQLKKPSDLLDPRNNIRIGTQIFIRYLAIKKNVYGALVRYSGGNKAMARKTIAVFDKLQKGTF